MTGMIGQECDKFSVLAMSGGGMRGLVFTRLLRFMHEEGAPVHDFDLMAGNSASSPVIALLAVRDSYGRPQYSVHDIDDIFLQIGPELMKTGPVRSLKNLLNERSLFSTQKALGYFRELYGETRLGDIDNRLIISAHRWDNPPEPRLLTNFECPEREGLHYSPDVKLYDAVAASIAVPFVFSPAHVNGERLVDGGVYKFFPLMDAVRAAQHLKPHSPGVVFDEDYYEDLLVFGATSGFRPSKALDKIFTSAQAADDVREFHYLIRNQDVVHCIINDVLGDLDGLYKKPPEDPHFSDMGKLSYVLDAADLLIEKHRDNIFHFSKAFAEALSGQSENAGLSRCLPAQHSLE